MIGQNRILDTLIDTHRKDVYSNVLFVFLFEQKKEKTPKQKRIMV